MEFGIQFLVLVLHLVPTTICYTNLDAFVTTLSSRSASCVSYLSVSLPFLPSFSPFLFFQSGYFVKAFVRYMSTVVKPALESRAQR